MTFFKKKSSLWVRGLKHAHGRNTYADGSLLHDLVTIEFVNEIGHQTPISNGYTGKTSDAGFARNMKPLDLQTDRSSTQHAKTTNEYPMQQQACDGYRLSHGRLWKWTEFVFLMGILGYLFCTCFSESFFLGDYKTLPPRQLYMVLLASLFLYFCVKARYLGCVMYFVVCTLSIFLIYAQRTYGCVLSEALVRAVLETNLGETAGFVNWGSISSFLLGVLISVALYLGARWIVKWHEKKDSSPGEGSSWKRNRAKRFWR